ncbi:GNAT family N-acetyltransferase [Aurantimonas aggregata]|uniref:GNAT family N-acetyltransferase n=2 Tax=Aurantimonas aggregata TaxID=2047720 RepID=A0A6L9MKU7_9HYPH|nr:GNAT family N-acetyltransferase [Aurantimonas aggregata]NDV88262.1 GNAT family N-acetyltransferase [Aurantimonas aggregata]
MTDADMALAVEWAACEGWNPGLSDAALFRQTDPDGFLVAIEAGEPVACISVVAYGGQFGFLGFYIVRPDRRGHGIGWTLWQAGMARLAGRTVGLDGVVDQQDNYRRAGFTLSHRNIRHAGLAGGAARPDPGVRAPVSDDLDALAAFDAAHFGAMRRDFVRRWIAADGHRALLLREPDGTVSGYGVIRTCRDGFKVGPLFAMSPAIAARLFGALAATCAPDALIVLDTPEPNAGALQLAIDRGLHPVFETARMWHGAAPDMPLGQVYGVTTFELG